MIMGDWKVDVRHRFVENTKIGYLAYYCLYDCVPSIHFISRAGYDCIPQAVREAIFKHHYPVYYEFCS